MTWLVMIAVGAGSFAFRLGPLLLVQKMTLSERADRVIRQACTAAIAALVVVSIKKSATGGAALPTALAVVVAVILAARGASMVRLLIVGGATYAVAVIVADLLGR